MFTSLSYRASAVCLGLLISTGPVGCSRCGVLNDCAIDGKLVWGTSLWGSWCSSAHKSLKDPVLQVCSVRTGTIDWERLSLTMMVVFHCSVEAWV